jgi:SSS family solute:Na+ symporter
VALRHLAPYVRIQFRSLRRLRSHRLHGGFSIYIWWACSISVALIMGSNVFPGRWSRLRQRLGIISPLEYLVARYDLPAQQVLAWSGALLKIFDVGAKWIAAAILLQVFADVPALWGVLLTGSVTVVYSVVGGLWADALTGMSQFIIQVIARIVMLVAVLARLGGISAIWTVWDRLPASHSRPFVGEYTLAFAIVYLLINILSYNGGTWNLAQRFIAAPNATAARKAALLSANLYLVWPLVLFFPMWASPLLLPHLADPSQSYALLTKVLLPQGLIGLVLAGMFAHTMAMTSSDANAISAVVVRDILPALRKGRQRSSDRVQLLSGRICTLLFLSLSMCIALTADHFGGVIGLIILWYGALLGRDSHTFWYVECLPSFRRERSHRLMGRRCHRLRPRQIRTLCHILKGLIAGIASKHRLSGFCLASIWNQLANRWASADRGG